MRTPQHRTNLVQYSSLNGIDVYLNPANEEPGITMSILETSDGPILNVRLYTDRADLNVETARNLAAALNRFADQYSPNQRVGVLLHGVEYPEAERIVPVTADQARNGIAAKHAEPGYVGLDRKVHHDTRAVTATVYPEWETVED